MLFRDISFGMIRFILTIYFMHICSRSEFCCFFYFLLFFLFIYLFFFLPVFSVYHNCESVPELGISNSKPYRINNQIHKSSSVFQYVNTYAPVYTTLTLKAPNKNCSRRHLNFFLLSSAQQRIHLKHHVLFSLKKTMKNIYECRLLQS